MKTFVPWGGLSSTLLVCSRIFLRPECMNILFMHLFVYMCHGHFSLSEYVIMLDIDLCRKIPGHNKCTKWTCNQQRVSLLYLAWPPCHGMNSCLVVTFSWKTLSHLWFMFCWQVASVSAIVMRYQDIKHLNPDSLSVCWFACSKSIEMWVELFMQHKNCVNRYAGKGILSICKCYKRVSAWHGICWYGKEEGKMV
jgi:hypothetical protein